jgi:hypothetical protein
VDLHLMLQPDMPSNVGFVLLHLSFVLVCQVSVFTPAALVLIVLLRVLLVLISGLFLASFH